MKDRIAKIFPQVESIKDDSLKTKVLNTYVDAIRSGGWEPEDMYQIPFTLHFPEFLFSYVEHVRGVTDVSIKSAEVFNETYKSNPKFKVDMDLIIAGALLHDVGKMVEYKRNEEGKFVQTDYGKLIRHPAAGAMIAERNGCPPEVCHIIAVHAAEGDCQTRTAEAIIINKADFLNFDTICYLNEYK